MAPDRLAGLAGNYRCAPHKVLAVWVQDGKLMLRMVGDRLFDLNSHGAALHAASETEFYLDSRYHSRLAFTVGADGQATGVTLNPGRWAEQGARQP